MMNGLKGALSGIAKEVSIMMGASSGSEEISENLQEEGGGKNEEGKERDKTAEAEEDEITEDEDVEDKNEDGEEDITEDEGDLEEEEEERGEEGEGKGDEDEPSELDELKAQNKKLLGEMERILKRVRTGERDKEEDKEDEEGAKYVPQQFLDEDTYAQALESKESLNDVLNKVAERSETATSERIYKALPSIVAEIVQREVSQHRAADAFYTDNPDLVPYKRVVAEIYDRLVEENPEKDPVDILADLAPETRKALSLSSNANKKRNKKKKRRKTSFNPAGGSSSRGGKKGSKEKISFQDEVELMKRL